MKHILTSACFLLCATAFVACEPEIDPTPDNRSDYERLRDNVAIDVITALDCSGCHDDDSTLGKVSRLTFDSTSGADVAKGIKAYILLNNPLHVTILKQKPLGELGHAGGNILSAEQFSEQKSDWNELVNYIAAENPPASVGTDAEVTDYVLANIINSSTQEPCMECHGVSPLNQNGFSMASTELVDIEASISAYIQADDSHKMNLLGKPSGILVHGGSNIIDNDSEKADYWNAFIERLSM
ncbi:hypothetical protein [Marinicellulosiphila megalodicopiae]|uniref:hypothetical protein n=1 Tax=Marinicellulosiphila megalodicopiae TaxID=2724896 RepID=UPI003BAE8474